MSKASRNIKTQQRTKRSQKTAHSSSWHLRMVLALLCLFVVLYTVVVGTRYDDILRMMEGNSWVEDWWMSFFRWPYVGAFMMALPMALLALLGCVIILAGSMGFRRFKSDRPCMMYLGLIIPLFLAYFCPPKANELAGSYRLFSKEMNAEEQYYSYLRMADEKQWLELLSALREDGTIDTPIGMRYALLAESGLGRLPEVLFTYPVRSPEDLLFRGVREPLTCLFNRQFYDNLGIYDEAFHQAMEYALFQPKGNCVYSLRQMADYAIAEHDWKVAEKYLDVLETGWFNGSFVAERREVIQKNQDAAYKNTGADKIGNAEKPLRGDNFVGVYPFRSEMVRLAYYQVGDSQKSLDYLLCTALLQKNLSLFYSVLTQFPNYQQRELPESYQEALAIIQSGEQALRDAPAGTYAYYYYNVDIPEEGDDLQMSAIN